MGGWDPFTGWWVLEAHCGDTEGLEVVLGGVLEWGVEEYVNAIER